MTSDVKGIDLTKQIDGIWNVYEQVMKYVDLPYTNTMEILRKYLPEHTHTILDQVDYFWNHFHGENASKMIKTNIENTMNFVNNVASFPIVENVMKTIRSQGIDQWFGTGPKKE